MNFSKIKEYFLQNISLGKNELEFFLLRNFLIDISYRTVNAFDRKKHLLGEVGFNKLVSLI